MLNNRRKSKETLRCQRLILAILQEPTIAKAAASIGVSSVTAWRISKTEEFKQGLERARNDSTRQARAQLRASFTIAVDTLLHMMSDRKLSPASRLQAASLVLAHAHPLGQKEEELGPETDPNECEITWGDLYTPEELRDIQARVANYIKEHPQDFPEDNRQGLRTSKKILRRQRFIMALLQEPTMEKAAASIGISPVTAWRITQTPEFTSELGQARADFYQQVLARLQAGVDAAVDTVLEIINDPKSPPACRLQATRIILAQAHPLGQKEAVAERGQQAKQYSPEVKMLATILTPEEGDDLRARIVAMKQRLKPVRRVRPRSSPRWPRTGPPEGSGERLSTGDPRPKDSEAA